MASTTVTGLRETLLNLGKVEVDIDEAVNDAIAETALAVESRAKKKIVKPSIGTYVTRYTAGGKPYQHVASKEGEAPNNDTGALQQSISTELFRKEQFAFVTANIEYASYLETVLNRPFLGPSLIQEKANFNKRAIKHVNKQASKKRSK